MGLDVKFIRLFFSESFLNISRRPACSRQVKTVKISDNHRFIDTQIPLISWIFEFFLLGGFSTQLLFSWIY